MRTILHVDFDSFFASCEQHFNPNLRGKPIGVTAQNGRHCVIAASREAKKYGLKSPNTTWEAKRICPEIIFVKADFERYLEITKKLLQIANSYSPVVELFSLDEVFIDITPVKNLYPSTLFIVEDFKKKLKEEVGDAITVSIGESYNKLLAKLATSLNKPNGYGKIDKENKENVFAQTNLTDIMGIGERYRRRLNLLGIFNFKQLAEYPMYLLKAEFGNVASENLKKLALGIDDSPVISYLEEIETKSVGRNYCLPANEYNKRKVLKVLSELSEEIAIKLRRLGMKGRTIGVFLRGDKNIGAQKTIGHYTQLKGDIFDIAEKLYKEWDMEYVRQVSLGVSGLIEEKYITLPLFEPPRTERIIKIVDSINDRFGHHTIRTGFLVDAPKLDTKPNGFLADRWQRTELQRA